MEYYGSKFECELKKNKEKESKLKKKFKSAVKEHMRSFARKMI